MKSSKLVLNTLSCGIDSNHKLKPATSEKTAEIYAT